MKLLAEGAERIRGVLLQSKIFVGREPGSHRSAANVQRPTPNVQHRISESSGHLHELDRRVVRIADVDDAFAGIWADGECLWFAGGFPSGSRNRFQEIDEILHRQRDVNRTEIAGTKFVLLSSILRRAVFEQLDLVSGRFQHCDQDFGADDSGDLFSELAFLMGSMRKFEAENVAPENEGALDVRDGDAGVIGGENPKSHGENVERPTRLRKATAWQASNVQSRIQRKLKIRCDFWAGVANHLGNEFNRCLHVRKPWP